MTSSPSRTRRTRPAPVRIASVAQTCAVEVRRGLAQGRRSRQGQSLLRDLGNLPGNVCTPRYLADQARAIAREHRSVRVHVFDEAAIRRLKMGCLLAVSRGSAEPPRFIVLEYRGGAPRRRAGGAGRQGRHLRHRRHLAERPRRHGRDEVRHVRRGQRACHMRVAALLKLPLNVVGLVPAVENMPGSRATKPGDIVTSAAGKTVEILNTDAEGRLILCDALHYARRFEPAAVVDIATLTGACVIALGHHFTGVMGNDDALAQELVEGRRPMPTIAPGSCR